MKLLPSTFRHSLSTSDAPTAHVQRSQTDERPTTFWSSFWKSYVLANPPVKRSAPLEARKDQTVTETEHITVSVYQTVYINTTLTTELSTTIHYTHNITIFQPTTITHNLTITAPAHTPTPPTVSVTTTDGHIPTAKATGSPSPTATPIPNTKHHLPTVAVLGIIFGTLALVGLIAVGLLVVRRFYRMYRRERVLRKQLQTEGNEMPVMKTGEGEDGGGKEERF